MVSSVRNKETRSCCEHDQEATSLFPSLFSAPHAEASDPPISKKLVELSWLTGFRCNREPGWAVLTACLFGLGRRTRHAPLLSLVLFLLGRAWLTGQQPILFSIWRGGSFLRLTLTVPNHISLSIRVVLTYGHLYQSESCNSAEPGPRRLFPLISVWMGAGPALPRHDQRRYKANNMVPQWLVFTLRKQPKVVGKRLNLFVLFSKLLQGLGCDTSILKLPLFFLFGMGLPTH